MGIPADTGNTATMDAEKESQNLTREFVSIWRANAKQNQLTEFLSQHRNATHQQQLQLILADQSLRARQGEICTMASYVQLVPDVLADVEDRVTIAVAEFEHCTVHDAAVDIDTFVERYHDIRVRLKQRLHQATVDRDPMPTPARSPSGNDVGDKFGTLVADSDPSLDPGPNDTLEPHPSDIERRFGSDDVRHLSVSGRRAVSDSLPDISDYQLIKEIARGGMGVVYQAKHGRLNRVVALKMILSGQFASTEEVQRFLTEAQAAAQLEHPNIVPIYEIGEHEGNHYFSMAYVDGPSLQMEASKTPKAPRDAAVILEKICEAVGYPHSKGIVHRDLKPANILIDAKGEPHITDFGLAKIVQSDSGLTASGQVMGTPSYMPPEQAAGRMHEVGPTADVYSLGAVLYELLTGRPPFLAATLMDTLKQVMDQDPVHPRLLNSSVDRDLETICLKCLSKEVTGRYSTASELASELKRYLAGEPIRARRIGVTGRAMRWCKRKPVLAGMCVSVVLALAAMGIAFSANRVARNTREFAKLKTRFEAGLDRPELEASYLEQMESSADAIFEFDAADGNKAHERLYFTFAEKIATAIRQPRISEDESARIADSIAALASRKEAKAAQLSESLQRRLSGWQERFAITSPFSNAKAVLAESIRDRDQLALSRGSLTGSRRVETPDGRFREIKEQSVETTFESDTASRLAATFDAKWQDAAQIGLWLNRSEGDLGYQFVLRLAVADHAQAITPAKVYATETDAMSPSNFRRARTSGSEAFVEIYKSGSLIMRHSIDLQSLQDTKLTMMTTRQRDQLEFQLGSLPAFGIRDPFPLSASQKGHFAVDWPDGVGLVRLQGDSLARPPDPGRLGQADELYDRQNHQQAMDLYAELGRTVDDTAIRSEAAYKQAICLLALERRDDAAQLFSQVMNADGDVWPPMAGCQLWGMRLKEKKNREADEIFGTLSRRFNATQIAGLLQPEIRKGILDAYFLEVNSYSGLLRHDPTRLERIKRAVVIDRFLSPDGRGYDVHQLELSRAYRFDGDIENALVAARQVAAQFPRSEIALRHLTRLLRISGKPSEVLIELRRFRQRVGPEFPFRLAPMIKARAYVALEDWVNAERAANSELAQPAGFSHSSISAALMKGFILERRGDSDAANEIWRSTYLKHREQTRIWTKTNSSTIDLLILGSLSGEMTNQDANGFFAKLIQSSDNDQSMIGMARSMLNPESFVQATRRMWTSDRGKKYAEQFAYESLTVNERLKIPLMLFGHEYFRATAFGGHLSLQQDEALWEVLSAGYDAVLQSGAIKSSHAIQLALTWKGTTNIMGWGGLAPNLTPELRSQFAFLFGQRFLQRGDTKQARTFFDQAMSDATKDSSAWRAANETRALLEAQKSVLHVFSEYDRPLELTISGPEDFQESLQVEDSAQVQLPAGQYTLQIKDCPENVTLTDSTVHTELAKTHSITIRWKWRPVVNSDSMRGLIQCPADLPNEGQWQLHRSDSHGHVRSIESNSDGSRIAVGNDDGTIRIYDCESWKLNALLVGHQRPVNQVHWHQDGQTLTSASEDKTVRIWNIQQGRSVSVLREHRGGRVVFAWSPTEERCVSVSDDEQMRLWSSDGDLLGDPIRIPESFFSVAWSPDGQLIATGDLTGSRIRLWNSMSLESLREFEISGNKARVSWSPDGDRLIASGENGQLHVWNQDDWSERSISTPHPGAISDLSWRGDGKQLVTVDHAGHTCIWSISETELRMTQHAQKHPNSGVSWIPKSDRFATSGTDGTVRIWDDELNVERELPGLIPTIPTFAWHPTQPKIAVFPGDDTLRMISPEGTPLSIDKIPVAWGAEIGWDAKGDRLAFAHHETIYTKGNSENPPVKYAETTAGMTSTCWSATGILATAGTSGEVVFLKDGKPTTRLQPECGTIGGLAWSRDNWIAAACQDGKLRVWDESGKLAFAVGERSGTAVAWSPDGHQIAMTSYGFASVWNRSGELIATLSTGPSVAQTAAFSVDGSRLAVGTYEGILQVWDVRSKQRIWSQHVGSPLHQVAWSPSGNGLAAVGGDMVLRFWNGVTLEPKHAIIFISGGGSATYTAGGEERYRSRQVTGNLIRVVESEDGQKIIRENR